MYTNDFDIEGLSMDALVAIMQRRMWDYSQLKKKIENLRHWRNMNSGEIGGAFKYKNSSKVHYAQTEKEIQKMIEENQQ